MLKSALKLTLPLLLAAGLSGCFLQRVNANVTSFHQLPADLQSHSFAVVPYEQQQDSLMFAHYADEIAAQLKQRGLQQAPMDQADWVVLLQYHVDDGRERVYSYPVWGHAGYGTARVTYVDGEGNRRSAITYVPITAQIGQETRSETEYTRRLQLEILDRPAWQEGKVQKLLETVLTSRGNVGDLPTMMPTLIDALFQQFPGPNGQPTKVSVKPRPVEAVE